MFPFILFVTRQRDKRCLCLLVYCKKVESVQLWILCDVSLLFVCYQMQTGELRSSLQAERETLRAEWNKERPNYISTRRRTSEDTEQKKPRSSGLFEAAEVALTLGSLWVNGRRIQADKCDPNIPRCRQSLKSAVKGKSHVIGQFCLQRALLTPEKLRSRLHPRNDLCGLLKSTWADLNHKQKSVRLLWNLIPLQRL